VARESGIDVSLTQQGLTRMPYANSQGIHIHYHIEGEGPPLVLQHGFTDSLESWYEVGYVDALQHDYRLISVDARGYGASDKPHDPNAYEHKLHVADILAVLDAPTIPKAHFLGYSMGGRIGFALAKYASQRFSSLMIGGANPYQRNRAQLEARLQLLKKGSEGIVAIWDSPVSPALQSRLLSNDVAARTASWLGRMDNPGLEDVLPTMTMPCLVFVGDADGAFPGVKECVTHMPHVTFASLPGLKHAETFFRSDLILPHVRTFLARVSH
jgi:pimeloyl-ACP methyl ester carboxylesterase